MVYDFMLLLCNSKEVSIIPYVGLCMSLLVIGGYSVGTEAHQPI